MKTCPSWRDALVSVSMHGPALARFSPTVLYCNRSSAMPTLEHLEIDVARAATFLEASRNTCHVLG